MSLKNTVGGGAQGIEPWTVGCERSLWGGEAAREDPIKLGQQSPRSRCKMIREPGSVTQGPPRKIPQPVAW